MISKQRRTSVSRSVIVRALTLLTCFIVSESAFSYSWHQCNGDPSKWQSNSASFQVDQCSIPTNSTRANDVSYSFKEWNAVYGMYDVFSWTFESPECNQVSHNNRVNEMYYGLSSEMDGAVGVTYYRYSSSCTWLWSEQNFVEADVAINGDYPSFDWGNPPCDTYRVGSRTTILHEMGHAIGLEHFDEGMSLMMTSDGEGKYCGSHTVTPHGDDVGGGRFLYGSGNVSHDVATSEFRYVSPNNVALNSTSGTQYVCPGDAYTFRTSVGNLGSVNETYNIRWYLSTNNHISNSDIFAGSGEGGTIRPNENGFYTYWWTITVPYNVAYGATYYLGAFVDWDGKISERYEDNNATYMARRIRIRAASQC